MFGFFKKKKTSYLNIDILDKEENRNNQENARNVAAGVAATNSARISTDTAAKTYEKPDTYTGNRHLYDSGAAKRKLKEDAFSSGVTVKDPYTGKKLCLTKAEAKAKYGRNWTEHLAESDHITPIEKIFNENKGNAWIKSDNINNAANSPENMEILSRKINNAKRSRTNEELVTDDTYLEKVGIKLSGESKDKAIERGKKADASVRRKLKRDAIGNFFKTGHDAGMAAAQNSGVTVATMSGLMNIVAVIKGEKNADDAIAETAKDAGKAAATGYVMGGGLTTISHTLSTTSSKFIQALTKSNVPGQVITAVMVTGDTLKRYAEGQISTQECLIELGEKGLNVATTGYAMAVGQTLIPIPIVGAAVGALVGSLVTSNYYHSLIETLQTKELESQERKRIIAEAKRAAKEAKAFREELESYLQNYFKDYQDCFDEALCEIQYALGSGDADGIISGANKITRKLGGNVYYDTVDEFKEFLSSDTIDIL